MQIIDLIVNNANLNNVKVVMQYHFTLVVLANNLNYYNKLINVYYAKHLVMMKYVIKKIVKKEFSDYVKKPFNVVIDVMV